MTVEQRKPLVVKLGPRIFPPRPPSNIWHIDIQQPSILHSVMMPMRGVQKMLNTDSDDCEKLKELLRESFPGLEVKVTEIATGDWEEDFGITFLYWDNLKLPGTAQRTNKSNADPNRKADGSQSGYSAQEHIDIRPVRGDPLGAFPAFAALRDKWAMRTVSFEDAGMHWVVRLEGDSFGLLIGEDRGDDWFMIRPRGSSRYRWITEVLHEMGLWENRRERADHTKLACVLEQNIATVLRFISQQEG